MTTGKSEAWVNQKDFPVLEKIPLNRSVHEKLVVKGEIIWGEAKGNCRWGVQPQFADEQTTFEPNWPTNGFKPNWPTNGTFIESCQ